MANSSQDIEDLAADIGANVYIDVARWHLYLAEAHLHTVLAERFYPLLSQGAISEAEVAEVLQSIPVKLGGGRHELPLEQLLPMQSQVALVDILETFQRNL
jgi:Protein of unknown function (DUF3181)